VFADGYVPREVEFAVVEQHPTLLNVTLHPAKVGQRGHQRRVEMPPWLGGSGAGNGMGVTRGPATPNVVGNRGDIGDTNPLGGGTNNPLTPFKAVNSPQSGATELEPYTFFNPGSFVPVTFAPQDAYSAASEPPPALVLLLLLVVAAPALLA